MQTCVLVLCACVLCLNVWCLGKLPAVYDVKACRSRLMHAWCGSFSCFRPGQTDTSLISAQLCKVFLPPFASFMSRPSVDVSFNKCSQGNVSSSAPNRPLQVDSVQCVCVSIWVCAHSVWVFCRLDGLNWELHGESVVTSHYLFINLSVVWTGKGLV